MIKVGVIGAGHWGKNLIRTFYEMNSLEAIVELNADIVEGIIRQFPDIQVYSDFDRLLDSSIPAVVIATPAQTHYYLAEKALLAGKDVFLEKPMTLSVREAEHLQELAEKNDRILMVGHMLVYQPAIRYMKSVIDNRGIGSLHSLHLKRLKLGKVRSVENVLWSLGVHDIAVCLYLTGQEQPDVTVSGHRILQPNIEDDVYLHMRFKDGVQAHLHTSWIWPVQERRLIAIGSEGSLVYNELDQTVTLHRQYIDSSLKEIDQGSEIVFQGESEPLKLECEHFLTCIRDRTKPLTDGSQGVSVVQVIEKAISQLKAGNGNE